MPDSNRQTTHKETEIVLNVRYSKLIPRFLELRRAELETIETAINAADFTTLARIGHNLHGSGASYGLEGASEFGRQIKEAADARDAAKLTSLHTDLKDFLSQLHISYRNTIVFVDDQEEILTLLQRLFAPSEYLCHFTSSASEALAIINSEPVDVLVSDLVMPEMGGLQLLSIVREDFPNIVRLVLSGQSQVPSILAAINTGQIFRYLTKPWRVGSEARMVIADAVAHANDLNRHKPQFIQLSFEQVVRMLQVSGAEFLLLDRDNRILVSSSAHQERWPTGRKCNEQREKLEKSGAQTIELDRAHTALIWPSNSNIDERLSCVQI